MKKLLVISLLVVLAGLLIPAMAAAVELPEKPECTNICDCAKLYRVSYFDEAHNWTTTYVYAQNYRHAATKLGLEYGRGGNCWVGRAFEWEVN